MAFLYPFLILLQPGILWPQLSVIKPEMSIALIALVVGMLHRRASSERVATQLKHPIFVAMAFFVLIQGFSVYYGGGRAIVDMTLFWLPYAVFVAASVMLIRDVKSLYQFLAGMLAGASVVIFYGLYAVATHSPKLAGNRAGAYGMYENHNDYTFIIVMTMPFAYMLISYAKSRFSRVLLIGYVAACCLGTVLSLSRGGIIALVMMFAMLTWATTTGGRRVMTLSVLMVFGLGVIGWQFAARDANQAGHYSTEDAKNSRYELWRAARKVFEAHPVLGVGSGRFSEHAQEYAELSGDQKGKVTHNTYLEVITGSGLLGFVSFMAMLWHIVKESTRRRPPGSLGVPMQIKIACAVSILALLFRAMLDAKTYDWSFFFLSVIAIAIATMKPTGFEAETGTVPLPSDAQPGAFRHRVSAVSAARPAVYHSSRQ
jgi:putative inorganic carbon (HCO3(-)) transporter